MGQRDVASDTKPGFKVNKHTRTHTQTQGHRAGGEHSPRTHVETWRAWRLERGDSPGSGVGHKGLCVPACVALGDAVSGTQDVRVCVCEDRVHSPDGGTHPHLTSHPVTGGTHLPRQAQGPGSRRRGWPQGSAAAASSEALQGLCLSRHWGGCCHSDAASSTCSLPGSPRAPLPVPGPRELTPPCQGSEDPSPASSANRERPGVTSKISSYSGQKHVSFGDM